MLWERDKKGTEGEGCVERGIIGGRDNRVG
jgi:hypothetical protein